MRLGCKASSKTQAWRAEIEVAGLCQSLAFSESRSAAAVPYRVLSRLIDALSPTGASRKYPEPFSWGETVVLRCATAAPRMDEPRMGEKWINDV